MLARVLRAVDDRGPAREALLAALHAHEGQARIVGITGNPGAGKSTLVDALIEAHRAAGRTVAVVAVDPTSPFTGGAILGDRIRMQRHFLDDGVFIRSLATRGHLGGLTRSCADIVRVLDAAGFDEILVETVGVGQDEIEIAQWAESTVVVMAPGLGDDVQAIKAGILEVADVFVVNKADRDGADATVTDLEQMIALGRVTKGIKPGARGHRDLARLNDHDDAADDYRPPVLKTIASAGEGVSELIDALGAHAQWLHETAPGEARRVARRTAALAGLVRQAAADRVAQALDAKLETRLEDAVRQGLEPTAFVRDLVDEALGSR